MSTPDGVRAPYEDVARWIEATGPELLRRRTAEAEALFRRIGITFAVYGEQADPERLIPFDLIPRVFSAAEWRKIDRGVRQRARALNAFLYDVYHRGEIIRAGRVPAALVYQNSAFLPDMLGVDPPGRVYSHIVGVDLVRTGDAGFYVLEDNCRTPSGVSYMLENREIMMRMFPNLFAGQGIEPVDAYPDELNRTLAEVAPPKSEGAPTIVLLTPGSLNSAYYEHSFLADLMGIELVEPQDLFVDEGRVWMRTTLGPERVDVIYRRIDDEYLDPLAFRADSMLGVPGLFDVYRSGGVTICSAPGAGIADDKAIYCFVPEMIRFYLGEQPILKNVPTWRCAVAQDLKYVLDHLP
ncbi:MAG: circularly permuted type 2 ATP-grasp protein, partial [Pseudomonadota bacterium]